MSDIQPDIRRQRRDWEVEHVWSPYHLAPERIELIHGKIFWDDDRRLRMWGCCWSNWAPSGLRGRAIRKFGGI